MVWTAISYYEMSNLAIVKGNQDSKQYCSILRLVCFPFAAETLGEMDSAARWGIYTHL